MCEGAQVAMKKGTRREGRRGSDNVYTVCLLGGVPFKQGSGYGETKNRPGGKKVAVPIFSTRPQTHLWVIPELEVFFFF